MNTARVIQLPSRAADGEAESLAHREATAQRLWARGDVEAAVEIWRDTLQRDPRLTDVRLSLARARQVQGQWEDAVRELSFCLPLIPDHPDVLAQLAVCCLHTQTSGHALVLLDHALRLNPDHRLARAARAKVAAQMAAQDARAASSGLLDWPEAPAAPPPAEYAPDELFEEACLALQQNHRAQARARLEELLLIEPSNFPALFELARIEEDDRHQAWAMRHYESALRAQPQSWEAAYNLARLYVEAGDDAKARRLLERALLLEPEAAPAAWVLAQLCERAGEHQEARFWLERTVKLDPDNADAFLRLGHHALRDGRLNQAAEWMERAYKTGGARYDTVYNLGLIRWRLGDNNCARALWLNARELNPSGVEAARALAGLELSEDCLDEAERHNADHPTAEVSFLLGMARAEAGQSDAAIAHYQTALRLNPAWRDAWLNLGALLDQTGRAGDARSAWSRALALDPSLAGEYFG